MLLLEQKSFIKSFIKNVYIINLPSRRDRLDHIVNEIISCFGSWNAQLIEGIRFSNLHFLSGRAGNSAAMCKALTLAHKDNIDNVLILEDDCLFIRDNLTNLYDALVDLSVINWDILYLGARIKSKMTDFSKGLYRISNFGCAHAVLYNKKIISNILNLLPSWDAGYDVWMDWVMKNDCFDVWLPRVFGANADFFIFHPKQLCALQKPGFSDINQKEADGIRIFLEEFEKYK